MFSIHLLLSFIRIMVDQSSWEAIGQVKHAKAHRAKCSWKD